MVMKGVFPFRFVVQAGIIISHVCVSDKFRKTFQVK